MNSWDNYDPEAVIGAGRVLFWIAVIGISVFLLFGCTQLGDKRTQNGNVQKCVVQMVGQDDSGLLYLRYKCEAED